MLNPMLTGINNSRIMQVMQQIKSLRNPQIMLQSIPQYKQAMDIINANSGDAKSAFYSKAKEMGVDPDEIVKAMRNA